MAGKGGADGAGSSKAPAPAATGSDSDDDDSFVASLFSGGPASEELELHPQEVVPPAPLPLTLPAPLPPPAALPPPDMDLDEAGGSGAGVSVEEILATDLSWREVFKTVNKMTLAAGAGDGDTSHTTHHAPAPKPKPKPEPDVVMDDEESFTARAAAAALVMGWVPPPLPQLLPPNIDRVMMCVGCRIRQATAAVLPVQHVCMCDPCYELSRDAPMATPCHGCLEAVHARLAGL